MPNPSKAAEPKALDPIIRPAVEGQGYELVDLSWGRQSGSSVLRVTIDRLPGQGYVSHDDCTRVSREVSALLDVHDVVPGHYSLEVSSPGVDRPLKRAADFQRFLGQRAKVRLRLDATRSTRGPAPSPAAGQPSSSSSPPRRSFQGAIQGVEGDVVRFEDESVGLVELHIDEIEKANLIFEPAASKAGPPRGPGRAGSHESASKRASKKAQQKAPKTDDAPRPPAQRPAPRD